MVGLILGSILLGFHGTIALSIVILSGLLLLPILAPVAVPSFRSLVAPLMVSFLSSVLLLYFIYLRNRIENVRQKEILESISALKDAENNIRKQELFQNRLLHTSPLLIYLYDIPERKVIYTTRTWSEFVGYSETDSHNDRFLDTNLHPDDGAAFDIAPERWKGAADSDLQHSYYRIKGAKGTWRSFHATQAVFQRDERGQVQQIISAAQDVTENIELEEKLQHLQKMETLGQLAGGVAHDFANMLTPIIGYSEMLLLDMKETDANYRAVKSVNEAGIKAKYLTQQLLTFGRKQVLEFKEMNLNDMIRAFEKILRRTIRENVDIKYRLFDNLAPIVADVFQMEQIIMNLSINAQDAMMNGGVLAIETDNVMIDEHYVLSNPEATPGMYSCLTISDTGTGIDPAALAHIFEPFFTTKEVGKGTGLGLATVYGIVKQHGGHITVYSEVGKGTTFRLYFPQGGISQHGLRGKEIVSQQKSGQDKIVLVVEDDEMVRQMVCRILEQNGYKTVAFSSPERCLQAFDPSTNKVDLLLTDIIMPGMNGKELFQKLLRKLPTLKVAYMSGYSNSIISHHGILDSGTILIPKPFAVKTLLSKVEEALTIEHGKTG
ncbi:response regulator [bacterium]|nr:response regulator [bacterium]